MHNFDYVSENRVECLGEAIKQMSTCDFVVFINKWYLHNGCKIEKYVCTYYNIPNKMIVV